MMKMREGNGCQRVKMNEVKGCGSVIASAMDMVFLLLTFIMVG
jgi:hypothetical protein